MAFEGTLCIECDYELGGLAFEGLCPECGVPIARSMRGRLLRYEPVRWLSHLVRGIQIWCHATVVLLVLPFVAALLVGAMMLFNLLTGMPSSRVMEFLGDALIYAFIAFTGIALAFYTLGLWLVTKPKAGAKNVLRRIRLPTRLLALAMPIFIGGLVAEPFVILDIALGTAIQALIIIGIMAHVWTWVGACAVLERHVLSPSEKVRNRLRTAPRDLWLLVILTLVILVTTGANLIALWVYVNLWIIIVPVGELRTEMILEHGIAKGLQLAEGSQPSAVATD